MSAVLNEANPFQVPAMAHKQTASETAIIQREVAEVQAASIIAKRYPRDQIQAMDRILQAFTRPTLAEAALYQYAKGGTNIDGLSIRALETIAQNWGNIRCGVVELGRREGESECMAYAVDLETNFGDEKRFVVRHVLDTKRGPKRLSDEREIYELIANYGARRKRACIQAVIPGDIQDAARKQIDVTLHTKAEVTPERLQALCEKFAEFGVTKEMLEKHIQRRLDAMTPALMVRLGKVYTSLKEGMSAPADWFDVPQQQSPVDALKDKLRAKPEVSDDGV